MSSHSQFSLALAINERFFYGWLMAAVGFVGLFASGPGQSFTVSIFVSPIIEELGLSRTSISSAYTLGTLTAAFGLSYVGRLIDRFGARTILVAVSFLLGVAAISFSAVTNLVALYAVFTALRIFGQGALMLTSNNLVSQWFVRRRGFALSLVGLGFAVGSAVYPPVTQLLIGEVGWRTAWVWLGVGSWVLVIPPALVFVRSRPEVLGLFPDGRREGDAAKAGGAGTPAGEARESWKIREALRTRQFWIMAVASAIPSMLITGMVFHQFSYFLAQGLSAGVAASVFTVSAVAMVVSGLCFGYLLDRFPARRLMASSLALMFASMYAMIAANSPMLAYAYGAVFGAASGGMMLMNSYIWPEYFGRAHLGSVQGAATTIVIFGASLGPLPFGVAFDLWGGYGRALVLLSLLPAVFAVLVFFTRPPVKAHRSRAGA